MKNYTNMKMKIENPLFFLSLLSHSTMIPQSQRDHLVFTIHSFAGNRLLNK